MEILNNLWTAISTPNEGLVNVLLIPAGIIENFLIMLLFLSILNIKTTKMKKFLYISIVTIVGFICNYIIPAPMNIIFNYAIMILVCHYNFKISFLKSIISVIMSVVIFALIGILASNPYITILNITSEQLLTIPIYRFFYFVIFYIIASIILFIIKNRKFSLQLLEDLDTKNKFIIFSNLVLGLLMLIIQGFKYFII